MLWSKSTAVSLGQSFPANLFPRHHVPGALDQHCKDSKRLFGKSDSVIPIPAKLAGTKIKFEVIESNRTTKASYYLARDFPECRILALVYARCGQGGQRETCSCDESERSPRPRSDRLALLRILRLGRQRPVSRLRLSRGPSVGCARNFTAEVV